jgi:hypothetical protein
MPCPHRDHIDFLFPLIKEHRATPLNQEAARALEDPGYYEGLHSYDKACAALLDPVWEKEYLKVNGRGTRIELPAEERPLPETSH